MTFSSFHHVYVKGVPSNSISAQQWEILINDNGDLLGKFFKRWQERSTLSAVFITEFKGPVSDAFDEIICLESNKNEASEYVSRRAFDDFTQALKAGAKDLAKEIFDGYGEEAKNDA